MSELPPGAEGRGQPDDLRRGLPMVEARDAAGLEREKSVLREIDARPKIWQRWRGYWGLSGPGWVQSALTLGAGTAGSSILAGSVFGYRLLWVQPVSMFLGIIVFAAIGHQALVTRARPYDVFRKRLHPAVALLWGLCVLLSSIVWQFPQYSLGTDVIRDMLAAAGVAAPRWPVAAAIFFVTTAICWSYGGGSRKAVRGFERILKYFLLLMVLSFLLVVIKTGVNGGDLVRGFFGFHIPRDREGLTLVLGMLGAAVGINMTFLYPYTLLARGWGREHRGLKNFDLGVSMFLPFVLATSLVVIACANTLFARGIKVQGAVDAAHALEPLIGALAGRIVFSLGVLSMCLTTAVIEMLIAGFVLSEMLGFELRGRAYKGATLVANIGLLGAFYKMPFWLPVLTSSFNLIMMPVAYIGFFILQNSEKYLGADRNRGLKGWVWNALLIVAIVVVTVGAVVKILSLF